MQQYLQLLQDIKDKGTKKPAARANMPGTTSLFGYQFRHNLLHGFPLLTTKKLSFKNIVTELLWFLRGDTNIKYLVDRGCNIWNEDAFSFYKRKMEYFKSLPPSRTLLNLDSKLLSLGLEQFVDIIKNAKTRHDLPEYAEDYELGDCGKAYGLQWREWFSHDVHFGMDQVEELVKSLRTNPESRRHIITAWNPLDLNEVALPPCHCMMQFNCRPLTESERTIWLSRVERIDFFTEPTHEELDEFNPPKYYLDCQMYQRSADVFLGVPYNIASYALLTLLLAKMSNMIPGEFIHTFGDVHIYDNHMEQVEEQLSRSPGKLPHFKFDGNVDFSKDINSVLFQIENSKVDVFTILEYNPQPSIKAKLSTGL